MRLKISNLNRAITDLSSKELDLYIYIVQLQGDLGSTRGICCKDASSLLLMAKQSFYNSLYSLEKKGFIVIDYTNGRNWNVYVLDNSFTSKEDRKAYLNLNRDFMLSKEYLGMNVNLKKFILRMYSLNAAGKNVKLTPDTLKKYKVTIDDIEMYFKTKTSKNGCWLLRFKDGYTTKSQTDYFAHYKHMIENYCRTFKLSYIWKDLKDTVKLFNLYYHKKKHRLSNAMEQCINKGKLEPRLINYICTM